MADNFKDLAKLIERRYKSELQRLDMVDRQLLTMYKESYNAVMAQLDAMYKKYGLAEPVDGVSIRKQDVVKFNILSNKLYTIEQEINALARRGVSLTGYSSQQAVNSGYYGTAWAFDQSVGVDLKLPTLPVAAIRASVYSDNSGLNYIKTWAKNSAYNKAQISSTITRGITQGWSYNKMASQVKTLFESGLSDAKRVVRTEAGRCYSEGYLASHDAANEAGIKTRKRWSSTLDMRTRPEHAHLDGTYADENGLFWIGSLSAEAPRMFGEASQDINCRCSVYDEIEGVSPTVRRIRGEGIVPYQTYEEWASKKGWTAEKGWPTVTSTASQIKKAGEAS